MTTLFAQPYDISACGFYFDSSEAYAEKAQALRNDCGQAVEEFEIQFIDGEGIDCRLFQALGVHQGNIGAYFDAVDEWGHDDKVRIIIATDGKRKRHPVFFVGLKRRKMPCFETRGMNFYGCAYACD